MSACVCGIQAFIELGVILYYMYSVYTCVVFYSICTYMVNIFQWGVMGAWKIQTRWAVFM